MSDLIPVRICGIPAMADVSHVFVQAPRGRWADSEMDCYGYAEIDYTICDRRGRPAPWLKRKVNSQEIWDEIDEQILDYLRKRDD